MLIGVISDTHGLLRPEALAALRGADHILHAGDVGDPAILDDLRAIAPLTAIRGNIDSSGTCARLPQPSCSTSAAIASICCTIWRNSISIRQRLEFLS